MNPLEHWLTRPTFDLEPHRSSFASALEAALETGIGQPPSDAPVWAWLAWLCDTQGFAAHGTGQPDLQRFEPRQSNDVGWFGNRQAVYASSDALWAMFFAVMNRPAMPMTVVNAAVSVDLNGTLEPRYFFGANRAALEHNAFRDGWVYLLPAARFEREPGDTRHGVWFESHHLASLEMVSPAFRVAVRSTDFPFLGRIHAYDEDVLQARIARDPNGFPWLEDA
jgi:hypothetical protein